MKNYDNIYFVGLMGAGKTTIGRHLARRLNKRFIDCDNEIEARCGVTVPVIFEIEGEAGFRVREAQILKELASEHDLVLATGGGVVLNPENRAILKENGLVIYLCLSPDELYARTRHDRNRPLLQVPDPKATLVMLYEQRDALYREVADIIIDTHGQSPFMVLHLLEQEMQ